MSTLGGITRPLQTVLQSKQAKAQKIKKISLKVKFKGSAEPPENKKDAS